MSAPTATTPPTDHVEPSPLAVGFAAARANFWPGLVLIGVAVAIAAGYYQLPPVARVLDRLAAVKLRYGMPFAVISTALFGGVLPLLVQQLRPSCRGPGVVKAMLYFTTFWALKGVELDLFYRFQATVVGDNARLTTILCKVFVDEGIYCPIWAVPITTLAYLYYDCGCSLTIMRRKLGTRWYARHIFPTLLANWFVWIPAVAMIYCLKLPLQLPVQNIVLCLWAILMLFMTRQDTGLDPRTGT